jgi:hypothetical protein
LLTLPRARSLAERPKEARKSIVADRLDARLGREAGANHGDTEEGQRVIVWPSWSGEFDVALTVGPSKSQRVIHTPIVAAG